MSDARNRARHEVITYCHRLQAEHLVYSTAGNVSTRVADEPELIAMTPTSLAYDSLEPEDICIATTGGELVESRRGPTTSCHFTRSSTRAVRRSERSSTPTRRPR